MNAYKVRRHIIQDVIVHAYNKREALLKAGAMELTSSKVTRIAITRIK